MSLRTPIQWTQYRGNVLTTAPTVEPVTAAELQTFLKETATGLPDAEAEAFISQARQWIEDLTGISMITQSWTMTIDQWPQAQNGMWWSGVRQGSITELYDPANLNSVFIPRYPLSSVTTVTTYSEDGTGTAVVVADTFDIDTQQRPGRITLKRGTTWPVALKANNAIAIEYVSGYGTNSTAVPFPLVRGVLQLAAALYASRGDGCGCGDVYKTSGAEGLVSIYSVARI